MRVAEDNAARSYAALGGQVNSRLIQVKQVPIRVLSSSSVSRSILVLNGL